MEIEKGKHPSTVHVCITVSVTDAITDHVYMCQLGDYRIGNLVKNSKGLGRLLSHIVLLSLKPTDTHPPKLNGDRHDRSYNPPMEDLGGDAQLKKRLTNAESRIRELTAINEQWAIESQEKDSEIKVLQIQLEDAE